MYHYGKNKKVDTIKVYIPTIKSFNLNGNDIGYHELYTYKYDKNDSLIEMKQPSLTISYLYKDGKLLEEKKTSSYGWTLTKKFNNFNECDEAIYNDPSDEKLYTKTKYEYNDNNDVIKQTNYNYLNEPVYHGTINYTYY